MARQYTTPIINLLVKDTDLTGATAVYVSFSNKIRNVSLKITSPTVTSVTGGTQVSVHLTQAQTATFLPGEDVDVQVNWMASGERYATEIATEVWKENLLKEVLS